MFVTFSTPAAYWGEREKLRNVKGNQKLKTKWWAKQHHIWAKFEVRESAKGTGLRAPSPKT